MDTKIKIPEEMWNGLARDLLARLDVETAGLLFGEVLRSGDEVVIAVRTAIPIPEAAYRVRRRDQLSIDPVALNRLVRPARDRGWSVLTIHTHPGANEPWFSSADDAGDSHLMPSLHVQIPSVPHGSLVMVDGGSAIARTFVDGGRPSGATIQLVGRTLRTLGNRAVVDEEWFARQTLALGAWGQNQLRRLRVGVVGLGGIGSMVAAQLAHLGVGSLVLVDGDRLESSNLSRVVGATRQDVDATFKVDVAARYVRGLGLGCTVDAQRAFVGPNEISSLGGCDVIMSCVDRQTPRALLNRFAYRNLVPVIDMGAAFRVDRAGAVTGEAGRVVVIGPGRPCLACWGHLDANALRVEALALEDRERELGEGYITGASEPQPAVIAFNGMVASAGVIEFLRLSTGFAGAEDPPARLAFSFTEGTVRRNRLAGEARCQICGGQNESRVTHTAA